VRVLDIQQMLCILVAGMSPRNQSPPVTLQLHQRPCDTDCPAGVAPAEHQQILWHVICSAAANLTLHSCYIPTPARLPAVFPQAQASCLLVLVPLQLLPPHLCQARHKQLILNCFLCLAVASASSTDCCLEAKSLIECWEAAGLLA
jgi:hypothetical protein